MADDFDISILEREYEEVMREMRQPIGGDSKAGVYQNIIWGHRWRAVSAATAFIANKAIREAFVPAFMGASVSRNAQGQFASLLQQTTEQDFPLLTRWWRSLRQDIQTVMRRHWSPLRAPFFGATRRSPQVVVEVNPLEIGHFDMNDKVAEIVATAAEEALIQTADTWVGPVLNDYVSPKPYNTYH